MSWKDILKRWARYENLSPRMTKLLEFMEHHYGEKETEWLLNRNPSMGEINDKNIDSFIEKQIAYAEEHYKEDEVFEDYIKALKLI